MTKAQTFSEATAVLAAAIDNYESRPEQARLAVAIEDALGSRSTLVGQGGCGVGKSFASLVPAILSGKRTVYSTATKALQEQIAQKDLPFLAKHFPTTFAILKGRSNYLCLAKMDEVAASDLPVGFADAVKDSALGQREELPEVSSAMWSRLTASGEECPGKKNCPFGEVCFAEKAKQAASEATVVVVNHALLATDAVVRSMSDGNASMIGSYDALIVDEAHELEDYVSSALATTFRLAGITNFVSELRNFGRLIQTDRLNDVASDLNSAAIALFDRLPTGRLRMQQIDELSDAITAVEEAFVNIAAAISHDDVLAAVSRLNQLDAVRSRMVRDRLRRRAARSATAFRSIVSDGEDETVRFVEEESKRGQTFKAITVTPVTVSNWLAENLWSQVSPILISATILVGGKSDYIADRLGIADHRTVDAGSPFDYARQARLYVPRNLPVPSGATAAAWSSASIAEMERLVLASEGRALLLFTSRREMETAWNALVETGKFDRFPCKRQGGDETNQSLMQWFKNDKHSVLFALKSFFTGIDIQGDSLGLVVINKLPFPVPTEPVFEARSEAIKRRGGNDFGELTIPAMTLPLQQAAGRLIRTRQDSGVVAILDSRLVQKGYGATILRSLPDMPVVHSFADVQEFLRA